MKKTFEVDDLILANLTLTNPVPIKIEIRDDSIFLYIGQRDWQWDLKTGGLVGCGTCFVHKEEED